MSTTPAAPTPARRWLKRIAIALAGLVGVLALAIVIGVAWLHGAAGRRFIARKGEALIATQIRGRMTIGEVTKITRRGVVAHDLRFLAPSGEQVIVVDDADMEVDWGALLHGTLISPRTTARGGRVVLHDNAAGDLSIDLAFRGKPSPPPAHPKPPHVGTTVEFQRIDVSHLTLVTAIHGVPDARVSGIRTMLALRVADPGGKVLLTLHDLHGDARLDTPVAIHLGFEGGSFVYNSGSTERVRAHTAVLLGDNHARLNTAVDVHGDNTQIHVTLGMPRSAGILDGLSTIMQGTAAGIASSHFHFEVTHD